MSLITKTVLLICIPASILAQQIEKLYNPEIDAIQQIRNAVEKAAVERKHVLVQVGGNWCSWCYKLVKTCTTNAQIDSMIAANYVWIHVNYSKENLNLPAMEMLGYPQRFGFPVLVVLDGEGRRLHTQDSGFLEEGKEHSPEKVMTFLRNWTREALDPQRYRTR